MIKTKVFYTFAFQTFEARMAELVDALVSNTSGSNAVPVRSRRRVLFQTYKALTYNNVEAFLFVVTMKGKMLVCLQIQKSLLIL